MNGQLRPDLEAKYAFVALLVVFFILAVSCPRVRADGGAQDDGADQEYSQDDGGRYFVWGGRQHAFTGSDTENVWVAGLAAAFPVPLGKRPLLAGFVDAGWNVMPEALDPKARPDLQRVDNWGRTLEGGVGLGVQVGSWGPHRTYLLIRASLATTVAGSVVDRYANSRGVFLRIENLKRGHFIETGWGTHQRLTSHGAGSILIRGRFVIKRVGPAATSLIGDIGSSLDSGDDPLAVRRPNLARLCLAESWR